MRPDIPVFELAGQLLILGRLAQAWTGQTNPMLLAEGQRLAIPVNLVRQDTLWPASITVTIAGHGVPEILRLIVGLKIQPFDPGVAVYQADVELRPEFALGMGLSPDDGTHPGLGQAENPVRDAVGSVLEHETLLFVDCSHQIHAVLLLFGQFHAALYKLDDIADITPDVLQLLADGGANLFGAALFALGQPQKVPAGTPAVHPRLLLSGVFTDFIHRPLQLFPCLVEQIHVLGISDVRRAARGVQNQCTAVRRVVVISIVLTFLRLRDGRLQDRRQILLTEPLPERHQRGRAKGARTVLLHPDEVLQIRILSDVLHQPFVAAFHPLLDEQRPQCHPARVRWRAVIDKLSRVPFLRRVPWYQSR